jgi:hypothetical protein
VLPGRYTVTLIAGDARVSQPLEVRMDPRVKTAASDLDQQFTLSMRVYEAIGRVYAAVPRASSDGTTSGARGGDAARKLQADLLTAYEALQEVDAAPTAALTRTVTELLKQAESY